jgi:parallel beta-helix repeat protein
MFRNAVGAYLQLNASDISVRGIGIVAAASVSNGTTGFVIGGIAIGDTTGPLRSVRRVHVQDCYIADVSGHGIICQQEATDCVISGNVIERVGATAEGTQLGDGDGHGISVVGTGHVVSGNIVRDGLMRGIEVFGTDRLPTNDCTITGNSISGNAQDAITVKDVTRSTITGNTCSKNGRFGIYLGMASLIGINDVTIAGNSVVLNANDGIHIEGNASRIAVTGNTIEKNSGCGINVITARGVNPSNITIMGCTIYRNHQYGVSVNSGTQISITGNTVVESGHGQARNQFSGIWVIGVSAHVSITGNTCFDGQEVKTQQYGIAVSGFGPANYVVVIGNECSGNGDLKEDISVAPTTHNKLAWCGGRYTGRGAA